MDLEPVSQSELQGVEGGMGTGLFGSAGTAAGLTPHWVNPSMNDPNEAKAGWPPPSPTPARALELR